MAKEKTTEAGMVPKMYQVLGGLADESIFEAAQDSLDAIHETGGTVVGFAFQSPGKMAILAYVPPEDAGE